MEKIGIIGSGNMGRALGTRFAQLGHQVFFGAREALTAAEVAAEAGFGSQGGTVDQAAAFGDLLLWSLRESNPANVVSNPELLGGKIIMDLNNRDHAHDVQDGSWFAESLAERLQQQLPPARVVKAFNTLAMESFDTQTQTLMSAGAQVFLAGGDGEAKARVAALAEQLGFESIDLGNRPVSFRAAEALGDVIRLLMIAQERGGAAHLKLITLPPPDLGLIGSRKPSKYA